MCGWTRAYRCGDVVVPVDLVVLSACVDLVVLSACVDLVVLSACDCSVCAKLLLDVVCEIF